MDPQVFLDPQVESALSSYWKKTVAKGKVVGFSALRKERSLGTTTWYWFPLTDFKPKLPDRYRIRNDRNTEREQNYFQLSYQVRL